MHRAHRSFAFHHGHAAGWPAEDEVGIEALPSHRVVARATGMIDGEHDFRHPRTGHGFDEACPGADNAFVFGVRPYHESGDVLHEEDG